MAEDVGVSKRTGERLESGEVAARLSDSCARAVRRTFHGRPRLLADSLPDRFGNALIDAWLATQGRTPESFSAIERLCYTGTRGMGGWSTRRF